VQRLKSEGYIIISIEQADESVMLNDYKVDFLQNKYALIFGNEVEGVSEQIVTLSDVCIEIPQFGTKHSLNIAVSVWMVTWEFCRMKNKR
jgi:23S rRNA (guanosine2251-2'-O)-methyltransferase